MSYFKDLVNYGKSYIFDQRSQTYSTPSLGVTMASIGIYYAGESNLGEISRRAKVSRILFFPLLGFCIGSKLDKMLGTRKISVWYGISVITLGIIFYIILHKKRY